MEEPFHIAVQSTLLLAPQGKLRIWIRLNWRSSMHEHTMLVEDLKWILLWANLGIALVLVWGGVLVISTWWRWVWSWSRAFHGGTYFLGICALVVFINRNLWLLPNHMRRVELILNFDCLVIRILLVGTILWFLFWKGVALLFPVWGDGVVFEIIELLHGWPHRINKIRSCYWAVVWTLPNLKYVWQDMLHRPVFKAFLEVSLLSLTTW